MQFGENISLALSGLKSNKMRAFLTMLGIIIGIGAVISIVTIGNALTNSFITTMAEFGVNNIYVFVNEKTDTYDGGMSSGISPKESDLINDDMVEGLKRIYDRNIEAISLSSNVGGGKAEDERLYAKVSVLGVNDGYSIANNVTMKTGRFIKDGDLKSKKFVAVVSDKFVNNMFKDGENPIGKEVRVSVLGSYQTFTIIGVYEYKDSIVGGMYAGAEKDITTQMFIPVTTTSSIRAGDEGYSQIMVMAKNGVNLKKFSKDMEDYFNKSYKNNNNFNISTVIIESQISSVTKVLNSISIGITVIAGISLMVGGIGVMNIMLVSVTERTREIGTRKALGAKNGNILAQFIVEAMIICAIGGFLGVLLGLGGGSIGAKLIGFPASPSIPAIIVAEIFSMIIGVFFGFYPALKAAELDPIEALRYE